MSDNIPFEIQVEIMKRLPVKSLIQFRSVSKQWRSLIDSSEFINNYHRTQQHHHLLVSYINPENESEKKYVSIVDDDTFPHQKFSPTLPSSVTLLYEPKIVASSQGLVCFYDRFADSGTKTAVIWNPVIRKSVTISVPNVLLEPYITALGFGVIPDTCDPKLVKVSFDRRGEGGDNDTVVELFTLSTKAWKRLTTNLPCNSTAFKDYQVRESLVVAQMKVVGEKQVVGVWMMEHGDPKSLTKKFTINTPNESFEVRGFRKSGEALLGMIEDDAKPELDGLFVYEPYSGRMKSVGITATKYSWNASSCIETLLLLDN